VLQTANAQRQPRLPGQYCERKVRIKSSIFAVSEAQSFAGIALEVELGGVVNDQTGGRLTDPLHRLGYVRFEHVTRLHRLVAQEAVDTFQLNVRFYHLGKSVTWALCGRSSDALKPSRAACVTELRVCEFAADVLEEPLPRIEHPQQRSICRENVNGNVWDP